MIFRPQKILLAAGGLLFAGPSLRASDGSNTFVFAQIVHEGDSDPSPSAWDTLRDRLVRWTSLQPAPERRLLTWEDPNLFSFPFVCVAGRKGFTLTEKAVDRLGMYVAGGGFIFFDNSAADRGGSFARAVKGLPERWAPGAAWQKIPPTNALHKSFFLLERTAGRRRAGTDLWGLWLQDRLVAVYSENDLLGAVARDSGGNPLYNCEPDGEEQRLSSEKWLVNIVLFALTGTYKTDAIHQPFLERKGVRD